MTKPQEPNSKLTQTGYGHVDHANSVVHWHPFGQEAFDLAKQENKPVFVTIGFP